MISFSKKNKLLLTLLVSGGIFIVFSSCVSADQLGDKNIFFLDSSFDFNNRASISATLMKVSTNVYCYIEDPYWQSLSSNQQTEFLENLDKTARDFDEYGYPATRNVFGSEWKPGVDNKERITILLTKLKSSAGGYFNPRDEVPKSQEPTSNEREMIYINATQIANPIIDGFIVHEFQHLINWNQKERLQNTIEDVWLNEAKSEYAPTAATYDSVYVGTNLERRVNDFLANSNNSLTEWTGDRYDYPPVNLFGHYLAEQFGEDIFSRMNQNNKVGIYEIEQALRDKGYNLTFPQVFNNWTIASYLNDASLKDGRYGYKNPYLKGSVHATPITYSIVSTSIINIAQNIKDWSPYWYKFVNRQDANAEAKDFEIEFEGSSNNGNFTVIYVIDYISKPTVIGYLKLSGQYGLLKIPDFKTDVDSAVIIVSNQFKKGDFTNNEPAVPFILSAATTLFTEPVSPPESEDFAGMAKPSDYGLKEGDLIRAQGDFDVFIINQVGYKRLFLNPTIFNMYGHLTGGWKAVKTVTPEVRDAFITSKLFRYVDSPKVYELEVTGEDTGKLYWLNITGEQFLSQGGKAEAIFTINKSELDWYPKGADKTSL